MTVSANLACQRDAVAQQSAAAAEDPQREDSATTPELGILQTCYAPSGSVNAHQLPAPRLLADDAVQTIGQDVALDTTERATQTAVVSTSSNQTMPQQQPAWEILGNGQPLQRLLHHAHGIQTLASVLRSAPRSAQQQVMPDGADLRAYPAAGSRSKHPSPETVQHMSLQRLPPVRTQRRAPPRAPAQLLRPQLVEHTAHGSMASPRGWHQQWRIAAYAQQAPRAPSSRGGHGDQLAEAVSAQYDALERHMDAARLRQKSRAERRRGLAPISEGSTSRPRSPGSVLKTAQRRRRQQPCGVPAQRQQARRHDGAARHELGPDSPQTPAWRDRAHGLPEPARAEAGRAPQRNAEGALIAVSINRGDAHHTDSQIDERPSPVAAAGLSMLQLPRDSRHMRDSKLDQLQSAYHLADAIAERLGSRLADQAAERMSSCTAAGQSHAGNTGSLGVSQQRPPGPPRPRSPGVDAQRHGFITATIAEAAHVRGASVHDSAAPAGRCLDAAELQAALARLCDVATAHACPPLEPSAVVDGLPSLAWNGLIQLTRIWGSFATLLSPIAVSATSRAAVAAAAGLGIDESAAPAVPRSKQDEQGLITKCAAVQQASEGAGCAPPAAQADDVTIASVAGRSQAAVEQMQPPDTALQTRRPSLFETPADMSRTFALRLLRAPAGVVLPDSTRTGPDGAADGSAGREVCPKCRRRRAPDRIRVGGIDPVVAGMSDQSGGACDMGLRGGSAELTAAEGECLTPSLGELNSNNSASHPVFSGAALHARVALTANTDSEESNTSKSGRLSEPESPLSAVSAADAQTSALLATHDELMPPS